MSRFMQNQGGNELYQIFRLILPLLDRERGTYGLKEHALSRLYAQALLLPPKEEDRLKHYKNPAKQTEGAPTGDFVGVLLHVMKFRSRDDSAAYTVHKVNHDFLDRLAAGFTSEEK